MNPWNSSNYSLTPQASQPPPAKPHSADAKDDASKKEENGRWLTHHPKATPQPKEEPADNKSTPAPSPWDCPLALPSSQPPRGLLEGSPPTDSNSIPQNKNGKAKQVAFASDTKDNDSAWSSDKPESKKTRSTKTEAHRPFSISGIKIHKRSPAVKDVRCGFCQKNPVSKMRGEQSWCEECWRGVVLGEGR
ncbi:hypothetical protein ACLMJK_009101 [Lecanora helva]